MAAHTNSLIHATSPYLLQHAHNPVDWHEWSDEILLQAKATNKPIIVSIGYAACHWCHVMERECFENEAIAAIMNENFINIKVDREERPDIDQIYMDAIQAMGLRGGWPLNVFLTSDAKPFYGGTYFPPANWIHILKQVAEAYRNHYEEIYKSANGFVESIAKDELQKFGIQANDADIYPNIIEETLVPLKKQFDPKWGGMNKVPKFPMPCIYEYLFRAYLLAKDEEIYRHTLFTLKKIAQGGIYDQLSGGFMRYSTDEMWQVPHFEKMLYDNAQLLPLYATAYQLSGDEHFKQIVEQTFDFIKTQMTSPEGGLYSAYDADSEGEEGKYYVWTAAELKKLLNEDYNLFANFYQISEEGNWEHGKNILWSNTDLFTFAQQNKLDYRTIFNKFEEIKSLLAFERNKRTKPGLDDKILASWNGLAIKGLVQCYHATGRTEILEFAIHSFKFIETYLLKPDYTLYHSHRLGKSTINAFLEDYAAVISAAIVLYEATFDENYLHTAYQLAIKSIEKFADNKDEFLYFTSVDDSALIARKKEIFDNVIPSSNSIMMNNFYTLGRYFESEALLEAATNCAKTISTMLSKEPAYLSNWGVLISHILAPKREIVIVGKEAKNWAKAIKTRYRPFDIILATETKSTLPYFKNRPMIEGKTLVYICQNKTCGLPLDSLSEALKVLE
jgi:uncharacterized protein YyaL (SSP411 family)